MRSHFKVNADANSDLHDTGYNMRTQRSAFLLIFFLSLIFDSFSSSFFSFACFSLFFLNTAFHDLHPYSIFIFVVSFC